MSIEQRLEAIERRIDNMLAMITQLLAHAQPKVDPSLIEGQYGDPELKFRVTRWHGEDYKGRHFSECPPDLLDLIADSLEYFAKKAEENGETTSSGKAVAPFKRKDAERARAWAAKKRNEGWKPDGPKLEASDLDAFSFTDPPF